MKTDRKFRSTRVAPFFTSLALACALAAGNAGATIPVADVANGAAHWTNSISTYLSKIGEYQEYIKEYTREIERIKNLATQASSMISGLSTMPMQEPTIRDTDYGMKQCDPGFTGFSLTDMFKLVVPDLVSTSIPEQQQSICKQRQRLKNERHNELVKINKTIKLRITEIDGLTSTMQSSDTSGTTATSLNKGILILDKMTAEIQYSNTIVKLYDNSIADLDDDDRSLAKQALSGKKKGLAESLIATGAQTAAMCIALASVKSAGSDFSCL